MKKINLFFLLMIFIINSLTNEAQAAPCDFPAVITTPISKTSLTATITWPSLGSGVTYSLWYREVGTVSWLTPSTTATSIDLIGLSPNTLYEVKIRNACSGGSFSAFGPTLNFTTNNDPCAYPPMEEYPIFVNSTGAKIEWSPLGVGASYSVWYRELGTTTWSTPTTSDSFLNLSLLTPNTTYQVRMRTRCNSSAPWSAYGAIFTFTTLNEACAFPAIVEPITPGYKNALVEWNDLGAGTLYRPWYRKLPSGAWFTPSTYDTFMVYGGLDFDSDYQMRIRNECPSGSKSLFGPTTNFKTTLIGTGCSYDTLNDSNGDSLFLSFTGPTASIEDSIDGHSHGAVSICATQNASVNPPSGLYGYIYGRRSIVVNAANDGFGKLTLYFTQADFDNYNANNTNFLDLPSNPTDTASKNQYMRIAKVVSSTVTHGLGYKIEWDAAFKLWKLKLPFSSLNGTYYFYTQPDCISVNVLNLSVPSGTIYGSSAIATWDQLITPTPGSFELQWRKLSPSVGPWVNAGTVNTSTTSKLIGGLTPATSYEIQVRKNCSNYSYSAWSASAFFSTSSAPCYVPAVLNTPTPTTTTIPLSWSNVSAYRYFIWYKKASETTWLTPSTAATSLTLTGLTPGTAYDVKIRNNCVLNGELSAFSPVMSCTTATLRPIGELIDESSDKSLTIFPNPTNSILNIEMDNEAGLAIQFKLIDVTGRMVLQSQGTTQEGLNNFSLDLTGISNGVYILQVIENNKLKNVKQVRKTN